MVSGLPLNIGLNEDSWRKIKTIIYVLLILKMKLTYSMQSQS